MMLAREEEMTPTTCIHCIAASSPASSGLSYEEGTFIMIRMLLEEDQGLNLACESDRLVLTHQISKIVDQRKREECLNSI